MISVITWIIAIAAWLVILLAPVALVALAAVRPWRRWWLRPLLRRVTGRRPELVAQRTGVLELEAYGHSTAASAFPPEYRHMADAECAVCGGPLGYPFATTGRGNECRPCAGMTNTRGSSGAFDGITRYWTEEAAAASTNTVFYAASGNVTAMGGGAGGSSSSPNSAGPKALRLDDCSRALDEDPDPI